MNDMPEWMQELKLKLLIERLSCLAFGYKVVLKITMKVMNPVCDSYYYQLATVNIGDDIYKEFSSLINKGYTVIPVEKKEVQIPLQLFSFTDEQSSLSLDEKILFIQKEIAKYETT